MCRLQPRIVISEFLEVFLAGLSFLEVFLVGLPFFVAFVALCCVTQVLLLLEVLFGFVVCLNGFICLKTVM